MKKADIIRSVIAQMEGKFTTLELVEKIIATTAMNINYVGPYLAKFERLGLLHRCGSIKMSNKSKPTIIWIKNAIMNDAAYDNPMKNWAHVYPEFFKQFPVPTGRVYRLEM